MMIYLDNAATTRPAAPVIEAVTDCLTAHWGNPSSLHRFGLDAQLGMDAARKTIAAAIGAEAGNILFTSGATESSNLAIHSTAASRGRHKPHIVTSAVEHASVRSTVDALEAQGMRVTRVLPREDGRFYAEDFLDAVTPDTCLITMMYCENETGRILPVERVFRTVKRKRPDILLHCDAVQAFMKLPVHVEDLKADLMSMSAHKIHGPKGVGALYVRKGVHLVPSVTGGEQERGLRPGTEAVPLICGFGAAVQYMQPTVRERYDRVAKLREETIARLQALPFVTINSDEAGSPYILNFSVAGIRSEIMLHYLEEREIYVSSGSACSRGKKSGVLTAYGIPDPLADCAIRVSFCGDTPEEAPARLTEAVQAAHETLIHKS
ncbi:MAG: cysteine desulfurase [Oscillospiraceae bacterium]|nr:cysteine desulfurase [Oscillospiraceae bacterium]